MSKPGHRRITFGALQRVSAQFVLLVPEGSICGFIGPNGSGRTTTIRMILRIFPPDGGRVTVLGQDTGRAADGRLGCLPEERVPYERLKRPNATNRGGKRVDALSKGRRRRFSSSHRSLPASP